MRRRYVSRFSPPPDGRKLVEGEGLSPERYGSFISGGKYAVRPMKEKEKADNLLVISSPDTENKTNTSPSAPRRVNIENKDVHNYATVKTRSNERDETFIMLLLVCFLGAAVSGYLFYRSFYHIATSNAKPIAVITGKYRIAQRKFLGSMSWDRIGIRSDIYNGDILHTGELAELTVRFVDGSIIELSDNSMVQVFLNEKGEMSADLSSGSAKVDASAATSSFKLGSGDVSVTVEAGSSVAAATGSGEDVAPLLQVVKGNAQVESADGKARQLEAGDAFTGTGAVPSVIMLYPLPNERLVYYNEGDYMADFAWKCENVNEAVTLEVSEDKNYKNIAHSITTSSSEAQMRLGPGRYYWRINSTGENGKERTTLCEGKMSIVQSLPPKAVSPAPDYTFTYRTKKPQVRLLWTESALGADYEVKVTRLGGSATTEHTTLTSLMLPELGVGTYTWTVTAYLNGNALGEPSAERTFKVDRKDTLPSPTLYMPANKAAVNVKEKVTSSGKAALLNFSWKAEEEADAYRLKVCEDMGMTKTVLDEKISANRYGTNVSRFLPNKEYWWCVSIIDSEGNESSPSQTRTFTALDGDATQHLLEPPDGYAVSDNLLKDMKFSWNKSVPYGMTTYFEVARDEAFNDIVLGESKENLYASGLSFAPGTYYWRIRTTDSAAGNDGFNLVTRGRRLSVVPPLPKASVISPNGKAVATESSPYKFAWRAIDGAELYVVSIYDKDTGKQVYSDVIYAPDVDIDMYHDEKFKHRGLYRYEIQGRSNGKQGVSSSRTGNVSAGDFTFVRLKPVVILSPKDGDVLDGIDALLGGVEVKYSTQDALSMAQVILYKLGGNGKTVLLKSPSDEEIRQGRKVAAEKMHINTAEGIRAGNYEIVIKATTLDALDVSSTDKVRTRFSVLPIPPLESASSFRPTAQVLDTSYIKENGAKVTLVWADVKDATDYDIVINNGARNVIQTNVASGKEGAVPYYTLDLMSLDENTRALFVNGDFECKITPYRRMGDVIVQSGEESITHFSTNIASPKKSSRLDAVNPYARNK